MTKVYLWLIQDKIKKYVHSQNDYIIFTLHSREINKYKEYVQVENKDFPCPVKINLKLENPEKDNQLPTKRVLKKKKDEVIIISFSSLRGSETT